MFFLIDNEEDFVLMRYSISLDDCKSPIRILSLLGDGQEAVVIRF